MLLLPGSYQPIERKANGVFNGKLNKNAQVRSVCDKSRVSDRRTSSFACSAGTLSSFLSLSSSQVVWDVLIAPTAELYIGTH
jgi:hypothetical protein